MFFRQRDSAEGDQCSQGKLEQHGRASSGGVGSLQSKPCFDAFIFFQLNLGITSVYII